jgi:hypothetical protein
MKFLDKVGDFSLKNWWVWPILIGLSVYSFMSMQPRVITLDEKHWECGPNPVPEGLGARCTTYIYRGK